MIALLEDGLEAGALGMSSGLFTSPGSYAQPDEMIAFGHVLKKHNAGYFTHLRDEFEQGDRSRRGGHRDRRDVCGVHVEIVHFKCSGMDNWGKARQALDMIAAANARGLDVDCDAYPYAAGSNPLKNLLPQWVQAGGVDAMLARLPQQETRDRIRSRHRPRRAQQLGPHPIMGVRADLDLAATCRSTRAAPSAQLAEAQGHRSDRHALPTTCRRQGRDARAGHLDLRGRHRRHRALAHRAGRLRRQLRCDLRHRQPGHAASALLRHLPAHHRPLRARAQRAAARNARSTR